MSISKCPSERSKWPKFKSDILIAATGEIENYLLAPPPPPLAIPGPNAANFYNALKLKKDRDLSLKSAVKFLVDITEGTPRTCHSTSSAMQEA